MVHFRDDAGTTWDVFDMRPETLDLHVERLPGGYSAGWLVFESAREKRRLAPIPPGWRRMNPAELATLLTDPRCVRELKPAGPP